MTALHLVCPHCAAINRVPGERLAEAPRCGACKAALFNGQPVPLDAAGFERHLHKSELPLLVDFWASWCGPCRSMAPEFAAAAGLLEPRFRLAKLSTEQAPQLAQQLGIASIPTLALFVGGREAARQAGVMPARRIAAWAEQALASQR